MSTPLMNQLLEQAVEGCAELAARAAAAGQAAREVVEHAQSLGTRAIDDAERLHHEYTDTIAALKRASDQSAQAAETASHAVESVAPAGLEAATALNDMLVGVRGDLQHLAQARARAFHELDSTARQTETAFHDVAKQMDAFQQHLTARLHDVQEQLGKVGDAVTKAKDDVAKVRQDLHDDLGKLAETAAGVTKATAHALEQVLGAVANGTVDFANNAIGGHNELMAAVRQGYLDETKTDPEPQATYLSASFDEVRDALGRFEAALEPAQAALQAPTAAILDEGEKAVSGLADVAQNLQQSADVVSR